MFALQQDPHIFRPLEKRSCRVLHPLLFQLFKVFQSYDSHLWFFTVDYHYRLAGLFDFLEYLPGGQPPEEATGL